MASTAVCPFCFSRIDVSRLWYQCLGRSSAKCKKDVDMARLKLTQSNLETYRSFAPSEGTSGPVRCPTCGGRTNVRACPQCHSALPSDFAESQNLMVGLVGAKGSGKTVLMTVLVKQLRDAIGKRFDADISLASDNPDGHQGVIDYQANRENPLLKQGSLPPPTSALGSGARQISVPILLRWRQEVSKWRKSIRSTMLSFVDTAGEDLNDVSTAFTLQYLSVCDGLIVLLDPFALPGARATLNLPDAAINTDEDTPLHMVTNITEMLRIEHNLKRNGKIDIPVAVVFTKIDAFFPMLDRGNPLMTTAPGVPGLR